MSHALIPDFSVPMPSRPVVVAIEHLPLDGAALVSRVIEDEATFPIEHSPAIAGDALAAFVLIVVGALLIGCATLL